MPRFGANTKGIIEGQGFGFECIFSYICNLSAAEVAREVTGNGNAYTEVHRSLENNNNEQGSALAPKVSKEWIKERLRE